MKKYLLSPLFSPLFMVIFMLFLGTAAFWSFSAGYTTFFEDEQTCDILTYASYGLALIVALCLYKDFDTPTLKKNYFLFLILWGCALLREAGVQHWLTTTDTTAFKIRFFTNPNNPINEKIVAGAIGLAVIGTILYLVIKYTPWIWKKFFTGNPIAWTLWVFAGALVIGKFADRFPAHYKKAVGVPMTELSDFACKWIEEGTEATLPLLFAIALIQFHLNKKRA